MSSKRCNFRSKPQGSGGSYSEPLGWKVLEICRLGRELDMGLGLQECGPMFRNMADLFADPNSRPERQTSETDLFQHDAATPQTHSIKLSRPKRGKQIP